MWDEIIKLAVNYGLMSALFVVLLVWVLKNSAQREQRYQSMLDKMHDALAVMNEIQQTTKKISATLADLTKDIERMHKKGEKVK